MDEKTLHLKGMQSITFSISEDKEKGTFKGVAYSGRPVKNHGGYVNMIIDLDSMEFKEEIPVLRDHDMTKYIGKARLYKEDNQLKVEGRLFMKSMLAKEVKDLADDGANWELSVGLGYGELESYGENEEVEVNGYVQKGMSNVIRQPRVSEVSFVAIGADTSAFAEVFSFKNEEIKKMDKKENTPEVKEEVKEAQPVVETVSFTQEEWEAFACACGGSKESKLSEVEEKLKKEKEEMEKELAEVKKELAKYKKAEKKEKLSAELSLKGVELNDEKVEALINNEEKFNSYLEFLADLPERAKEKKIEEKFTEKLDPKTVAPELTAEKRQKLAAEMVKKGKAKSIVEALKNI